MAADMAHGIDGVAAADDPAARRLNASASEIRLRLGFVAPVEPIMAPNAPDAERNADQRMPVPSAGFEQQDANCGIGAEPAGEDTTCRSRPDNNVIELARCDHRRVTHIAINCRWYDCYISVKLITLRPS
jgi:hypothetical protein